MGFMHLSQADTFNIGHVCRGIHVDAWDALYCRIRGPIGLRRSRRDVEASSKRARSVRSLRIQTGQE
ncbi:uncharacterized protein LAESUDRAFT_726296, partial [Laetiporus sulphureus 93-53]